MAANLTAFLAMIPHSEGCDLKPDPYRVCYGYEHTIIDLNYHPTDKRPDGTVEWHGEPLSDRICALAGLGPGCISTAAGAYQITHPTWLRLKLKLGLTKFDKDAQDACAVELITERGALDLVNAGSVGRAIALCHSIWASFPGSTSGQPQKALTDLEAYYQSVGGELS
jgi:muramidase (phage lysozyme)